MRKSILVLVLICFGNIFSVYSQTNPIISTPERSSVKQNSAERDKKIRNDAVESRSECVAITDYKYTEDHLIVNLKNVCERKILSAIVRQANGRYILYNFQLESEKIYENKIFIGGYGVERGFILESVIFENGDGNGDMEAVRQIQLFYFSYRNEIEKLLGFINPVIVNPGNDPKQILKTVKNNIETLPDMFVDMLEVKIGGVVPDEKTTAYWRIIEIENDKQSQDIKFVLSGLTKLRQELEYKLSNLPVFPK